MSVAVLVPTHDRPATLRRSLNSLIATARQVGLSVSSIVVADDSQTTSGTVGTTDVIAEISASIEIPFVHLPPQRGIHGPGFTRNRGLDSLNSESQHSAILMVDDDMFFEDTVYQDHLYRSDGAELLRSLAERHSQRQRTVVGCGYAGRQDLSTLEHLLLLLEGARDVHVASASCVRAGIELESPGGISGAFLYVPGRADQLPRFFSWYNEDYFWLRELQRRGWSLEKSPYELVHAPPDGIGSTTSRLEAEQYGEALWCASRELRRNLPEAQLLDSVRQSLEDRLSEMAEVVDVASRTTIGNTERQLVECLKEVRSRFEVLHRDLDTGSKLVIDLRSVVERCCPS